MRWGCCHCHAFPLLSFVDPSTYLFQKIPKKTTTQPQNPPALAPKGISSTTSAPIQVDDHRQRNISNSTQHEQCKGYRRGPPSTLTTDTVLLYVSMNNALSVGIDKPIDFVLHTQLMDAGPSHAAIGPISVLVLHTQLLDIGPSHAAIGPISVPVLHTQLLDTGPSHAAIGPISVPVLHTQLLDLSRFLSFTRSYWTLVLHTQLLDLG
ncbi:hypothetical protein VIGAN_04158300 [Vigna angularis var. angularis]|uniref:Uncharacterized protein n=1 Tax=Vigna angularis var. angularis TaxID=157739 RepID=A0A0S3RUM6_PHAAN|nr:hypothetical protein VIGAN_04158300 [Vigna angularis var. angularis]